MTLDDNGIQELLDSFNKDSSAPAPLVNYQLEQIARSITELIAPLPDKELDAVWSKVLDIRENLKQ